MPKTKTKPAAPPPDLSPEGMPLDTAPDTATAAVSEAAPKKAKAARAKSSTAKTGQASKAKKSAAKSATQKAEEPADTSAELTPEAPAEAAPAEKPAKKTSAKKTAPKKAPARKKAAASANAEPEAASPKATQRSSGRSKKAEQLPELPENAELPGNAEPQKARPARTTRRKKAAPAAPEPSEPEYSEPKSSAEAEAQEMTLQPAPSGEAPATKPKRQSRRKARAEAASEVADTAPTEQVEASEQPAAEAKPTPGADLPDVPALAQWQTVEQVEPAAGEGTSSDEPLVLQRPKKRRQSRAGCEAPQDDPAEAAPRLESLSGVEAVAPQKDVLAALLPDLPELQESAAQAEAAALFPGDPVAELLLGQLQSTGRPIHVRDLAKSFTRQQIRQVGGWRDIEAALEKLARAGVIVRTRKKTYGLPGAMNLVRGRFQAASAGFGFVVPDVGRDDYYVPPEDTMEAWNGDTVLVRPEGHGPRGSNGHRRGSRFDGNPQASVVRIVERSASQLAGTLEYSHGYPILRADDFRARHRILLLNEGMDGLASGSRVVADLYWPEDTGEDEVFGAVSRVLGEQDDPETETEAVMVKYGLHGDFPPEVLEEAARIPDEIPPEVLAGRLDLRALNTFTVDGRDAKDFDDAIHIETTERGTFLVGIHIADVSHYVQAGTPLDSEAYARATSVYLPGRVLPMLPEHLSNGVCSLVPHEDRLTMSAIVELSAEAEILDMRLAPSIIHSKARLTYDEVQALSLIHI